MLAASQTATCRPTGKPKSPPGLFFDRGLTRQLSLLLAASCGLLLPLASHDLSKHHHAVAVQEGDTRETLAVLETVAHERLLWLEGALSHLVRFQRVGIFHLLAACLLAHLPLEARDAARR